MTRIHGLKSLATLAITLLSGCSQVGGIAVTDSADLAACEIFITEGLDAPSTYRRIDYSSAETPISYTAFRERYTPDELEPAIEMNLELLQPSVLAIRRLIVEYDATDAAGVPIRQREQCEFLLENGALHWENYLPSAARDAAGAAERRELAHRGIIRADLAELLPVGTAPCCLPY